jgi:hypothetical protein
MAGKGTDFTHDSLSNKADHKRGAMVAFDWRTESLNRKGVGLGPARGKSTAVSTTSCEKEEETITYGLKRINLER